MKADPLSIDPAGLAGSSPHQETRLWIAVNQRPHEYIRGHLLNHHVHGPGENRNLVPITGSCNTTMEKQAEHVIKKAVIGEGKVVRLTVTAKGKQGVRKHIPQEGELPQKMVMNAIELEEGDGSWKKEGASLLKDKEIDNTLPADIAIGTVRVEVNLSTSKRAEIDTIPGVGPVLADRIVKLRNKLGRPFHTYDDLIDAEGIGQETVDKLRDDKWVKLY
jgi:DNA uptake protein ComE-like DNA-binding protein